MNNYLPFDFERKLEITGINRGVIINQIQKAEKLNSFLASQAKFIHENIDEVYCQKLVYWSFKGLFTMYLSEYINDSTVRIGVVGSISYFFKEILEQVFFGLWYECSLCDTEAYRRFGIILFIE